MPLFESAIGGIAVSVLDQAIKAGRYAIKEIRGSYSEVEHTERIIAASNAYKDNYLRRQCQVKIMPGLMKEPLDLEDIYTAVKLFDSWNIRVISGLDELEADYRKSDRRSLSINNSERLEGMDIADEQQFLMVLGEPGIGKSTFLRKIGLEALKEHGQIQRDCIPVFLELKRFREEQIDIQKKIIEEFEIFNFPAATALVLSALEQGKLLVLFDGLDEVPLANIRYVFEQINDFVDKYDKNRFVISCRTAAYRSSFHRFTDVIVAEFIDEQIEQFIDRWFGSIKGTEVETARKYRNLLFQEEHKAAKELAKTPLLLAFLCLVYNHDKIIPNKRSILYERALNIIVRDWSVQKRVEHDPIYEGLHPELEKLMLAKTAYDSFKQDQRFFQKGTVTSQISSFLSSKLGAPTYLDADAVLAAIEVQQGILVERTMNTYSFSHLTLQEYLTALYIVENQLENEEIDKHLSDRRWREIFLLMSGLLSDRSIELLIAMNMQAQTYIQTYPKLANLISWAAENRLADSELYQRVNMIMIALSIDVASASASADTSNIALKSVSNIHSNIAHNATIVSIKDCATAINDAIECKEAIDLATRPALCSSQSASNSQQILLITRRTRERARVIVKDNIKVMKRTKISRGKITHHFLNSKAFKPITNALSRHVRSVPKEGAGSDTWQQWSNEFNLILLDGIGLKPNDITFSPQEAEALEKYLYINELLFLCKGASVQIPQHKWEKLERKLLTLESRD